MLSVYGYCDSTLFHLSTPWFRTRYLEHRLPLIYEKKKKKKKKNGTVPSKITLVILFRTSKRKVMLALKCMANYKFSAL